MISKVFWWLYVVYLSAKWMFRQNLGNIVIYQGRRWYINNGTAPGVWDLLAPRTEAITTKRRKSIHAPRKECKLVKSPSNILCSFRSGYHFYMTSWFRIWYNEGIKPWMRGCRIWGNH